MEEEKNKKVLKKKKNNKGSKNNDKSEKKKKMGRRPKHEYWRTEEGLMLISGWSRDGFTEEEIAKNMDVSRSTLNQWKNDFPDILNAIKNNKATSNYLVEGSVFKSIMGFTKTYKNQKVTKDGFVVEYEETVYIPPNALLAMFWMKNRMPDKWRDKVEITTNEDDDKDNGVQIVNDAPCGEVKHNA